MKKKTIQTQAVLTHLTDANFKKTSLLMPFHCVISNLQKFLLKFSEF